MQKLLIFLSINILLLTSCLNQQESNENLLLIDINDAKYNSLKFSIEDFKNIGFKVSKEYDVSWKEGVKDRRFVGPFGTSKNYPKYLDYIIWGNLIILCPSEKSEGVIGASDALENCLKLIHNLQD